MPDIIRLAASRKDKPDPHLVYRLEELLHRAKRGEIQGMIYAGAGADRNIAFGWAGGEGLDVTMAGAFAHVSAQWNQALADSIEAEKS